jgi:hypothetical protein
MTHEVPLATKELTLDADQVEVSLVHIKNLHFAVNALAQGIEGKMPLTEHLIQSCAAVAEYRLFDLMKTLGVGTKGTTEIEARHARLRAANLRIRELEDQLGQSQTALHTQMGVKQLHEMLTQWWSLEGFGHVSDIKFGPYGVETKLCGMLFSRYNRSNSKTPTSDRASKAQWFASLESRGFVLCTEKGERTPSIKDCDQNRDVLVALITQRMPSAEVIGFDGRGGRGLMTIQDVTVLIRDYSDILMLPQPEKDTE